MANDSLSPLEANPILDDGAPTATGSIKSAARLCEILGSPLELEPPPLLYSRGWGSEGLGAMHAVCAWSLHFQDLERKVVSIRFYLFDDDSTPIIRLDVNQYATCDFLSAPPVMTLKRPTDRDARRISIYTCRLSAECIRAYANICIASQGVWLTTNQIRPMSLAKHMHRFNHANATELISLASRAGIASRELKDAIVKVSGECLACARSAPPLPSRKIALDRVDVAFNEELQADFMYILVRGKR